MGGRSLKALRVPDSFWARHDVGDALKARDFCVLFRLLAKWIGASQTQIAIAVGMSQGQVSTIIAGERRVSAIDVAERALDGLEAPDSARLAFGFAPRAVFPSPQRDPGRVVQPSQAGIGVGVSDGPDQDNGVHRRDVLRLGSSLAVGAVVTPAPTLAAAMLGSLADADGEPASAADLTRRVLSAWDLRQRADYAALEQLMPDLIGQAERSASVLEGEQGDNARQLLVHVYNAASSLLRKLGDESLALLAADRAVRQAQALGDPVLTAAALYRLANVLLGAGRAQDARTIALRAVDLTEPGRMQTPRSLAMWGGLLLTAAVAAARSGEEIGAWELMGEARAASRLLGTDYADIFSIFGPTNVAIHGVQVAVELRRGRDAVQRSHSVATDQLPPSLVERHGQFLIDVAQGHVLEGADGEAVDLLLRADRLAPQEVRLNQEVRSMTLTMLDRERVGATPGLREFAARMGVAE